MLKLTHKLWQRSRELLPVAGYHFDRPLVLFQSDDWGRVGLRDQQALAELREAGLLLGERPYDFYSLETAGDLAALTAVLKSHRDATGRHPCLEMNFILANPDFERMRDEGFGQIHLLPIADGWPQGWKRPGLLEAYREGIASGLFEPALHGITHFCRAAVEANLAHNNERVALLRRLWQTGTPYIHWRMPWIGYEYWDPEKNEDDRFLPAASQSELIGQAVGAFAKLFSSVPHSACAPGYRANSASHSAWAKHGVAVVQNGPGRALPPYFDRYDLLQLSRTVEFEPAVDAQFSLETSLRQAGNCFEHGIPAVVSIHSINFHSAARDFCTPTLRLIDEFLTALESKYPNLLYLHDRDLRDLVSHGSYRSPSGSVRMNVSRKSFIRSANARWWGE
ncbi:MAG TPA: hypothetical protein VMG31_01195 [Verrucomicrobiae bacterium]|nr:hypothetical protein [Verrucomicrobiae bacterium]